MKEGSTMEYIKRLSEKKLEFYLSSFKSVAIVGPKFSGKTTLAKRFAKSDIYLTSLNIDENKTILQLNPGLFFTGDKPKLIDEWQLIPEVWDLVRHQVDKEKGRGLYILTCSSAANLDKTRHSGAGRIGRMIVRPMSLFETSVSSGEASLSDLLDGKKFDSFKSNVSVEEYAKWIIKGGWPEGIYDTEKQAISKNRAYLDALVKEDVNKVTDKTYNELRMRKIIESLARNTASEATNVSIESDVKAMDESISQNTLVDYLDVLNKLYIIEDLKAWNPNLRSKAVIRTSPARFFVDPSIGAASLGLTSTRLLSDFKTFGLFFEALVLRDIRVYADVNQGEVYRYKDSSGLEIDMIVELDDGRWGAFEIKMGSHQLDQAAMNLHKLADNIDETKMMKPSFLAIITATEYAYRREDGVLVIPLALLRD